MMRLDDSREAGLLNSSTQYSSLEMQMSEFDVPMSKRAKSRSKCYALGVCIALIAVAVIVSVSVTTGKGSGADGLESTETTEAANKFAPAPSPVMIPYASSPPAPPLGGFTEPVTPPSPSPKSPSPSPQAPSSLEAPSLRAPSSLEAPSSLGAPSSLEAPSSVESPIPAFAPSSSYHFISYETICNTTTDPTVCLQLFASNPNLKKVDLQQWTIMTLESAEQALNKSYTLAVGLTGKNPGSVALQQCIDVFGEALGLVDSSVYTVAEMDTSNPGPAATDVAESVTAAMTYHDTCQDGIDDVGPFTGSDEITGDVANHVDTLLSIALTFVNELAEVPDSNHHRRLLTIESSQRLVRFFPGKSL